MRAASTKRAGEVRTYYIQTLSQIDIPPTFRLKTGK
jgi:hypothetical protein